MSERPTERMTSGHSPDPAEERQVFVAARKQTALAGAWRWNQQYEDDLAAIERNPAAEFTLSADHRSALGYYKPMRDAAEAAGIDVTKDGAR